MHHDCIVVILVIIFIIIVEAFNVIRILQYAVNYEILFQN
jgi:hypothetical protein